MLVAKILLFATMVALAATNRRRLTPQVQDRDASALRTLTRNVALEIVAGIAVVAIVGALGVAIPAVHQSPVWPFSLTLSLEPWPTRASFNGRLPGCRRDRTTATKPSRYKVLRGNGSRPPGADACVTIAAFVARSFR